MKIDIAQLRQKAMRRPHGYIDDVLSHGEIVTIKGRQFLEISAESLLMLRKKYYVDEEKRASDPVKFSQPVPFQKLNTIPEAAKPARKAICEVCPSELFQASTKRCMHPRCGCPASSARVEPWENLRTCAAGHW